MECKTIRDLMIIVIALFPSFSWARMYGSQLCHNENYTCLKVKGQQTWHSLFPDEHDRDLVMRINRLNVSLYPGMVIAVPDNLENADIMDFSPFPRLVQASGEKEVVVDPIALAWGAYDADGNLVRWGPASAGANYCSDIDKPCRTHPGTFRIFTLGSSDCYSTKFPLPDGGAPMPYCMYFNNGQALHGEPNGLPGYNASHGCVRMYVNDAEWLRYSFVDAPSADNNYRGTQVTVRPYDGADVEDDSEGDDRD